MDFQKIKEFFGSERVTELLASGWFFPAVIVGVILFGTMLLGGGRDDNKEPFTGNSLVAGRTYYIWVGEIAVYDVDWSNRAWDSNGTGPDLYYELYSGNSMVFSSDVRTDTLVARWTPVGIDYMDELTTMLAGGKGKSSFEEFIQAGLFKATVDGEVGLRMKDNDFIDSTWAGLWGLPFEALHEGENVFTAEYSAPVYGGGDSGLEVQTNGNAVQSVVVYVIPADGMVDYLKLQLMQKHGGY
ncbi:hypothetical protein [Cerasicoccus fimbriatus]|uniref:hypothetical protein n=1 Tax=Cerasicoccus fimbriatus TaxID=3014554 RepID=UPI0022B4473A|nr:hypothetical protein [Cerasicoccus sp. TK19100]